MAALTNILKNPLVKNPIIVKSITEAYDNIIAAQMQEQNIPALSIALVMRPIDGTICTKSNVIF